jgi:RNA 2',3'-cyclic 3'-phosphodiesterase
MPDSAIKRLFFALEVQAPWPVPLPAGRRLDEAQRHMTFAFLGQTDYNLLKEALERFPKPPFKVGLVGKFDQCLFLPEQHPRVVAWHVEWLEGKEQLEPYQQHFIAWLQELGFNPDARRGFLPHVTLCRAPFNPHPWKKSFSPLPMMTHSLHLYESLGGLRYQPIWTYPLPAPFREIEHTADIAFQITGESLAQLQLHALIALAFKCPALLGELNRMAQPENLDDLIIHLNESVGQIDAKKGCPFKAVSFHGEVKELENGVLQWEMIVDV